MVVSHEMRKFVLIVNLVGTVSKVILDMKMAYIQNNVIMLPILHVKYTYFQKGGTY